MTSLLHPTTKRRRRFDKYQLILSDGLADMSASYMNAFDDYNFAAVNNKLEYITREIALMDNNPNRDEQEIIIREEIEIGLAELAV